MSPEREHSPQINFDEIIRLAKEAILRDGRHGTMLIIEGDKHTRIGGLANFPNTHEKRILTMQAAGRSVARSGDIGRLRQVFMISEGWMSTAEEGKLPNMRPAQDPNRKEVLIVSGLRVEDRMKDLRLYGMRRNPERKLTSLDEIDYGEAKPGTVAVPLLEAFADGFQIAFRERVG